MNCSSSFDSACRGGAQNSLPRFNVCSPNACGKVTKIVNGRTEDENMVAHIQNWV